MLISVATWFCYFVFYSFIGWICETVYCSLIQRRFINRGFLNGPFCPIYGFGAVAVLLLFSGYSDDIFALFLLSIVVTSVIEYVTSYLLEKLFNLSLWDYKGRVGSINGRVCLMNALMFGVLSVLMVRVIHPYTVSFLETLPPPLLYIIMGILVAYFLYDIVITVRALVRINQEAGLRQVELSKLSEMRDSYIKAMQEEQRGRIERRLLKAFPRLDLKKYPEAIEAIKESMRKYRHGSDSES